MPKIRMRRVLTVGATWVFGFVIGAVSVVGGTITHAFQFGSIPVGLVLALIGCLSLLVAIRLLTDDRWVTLATGAGMVLATVLYSGPGPGGSVVVPQSVLGLVWTISVPVLVAFAVAWPNPAPVSGQRRLAS